MKSKWLYNYALMSLIFHVVLSLNTCPKNMRMIPFSDLKVSNQEKACYYYLKNKINIAPVEINLQLDTKESMSASLIFLKDSHKMGLNIQKALTIRFSFSKEEEKRIFLQVQKCLEENEKCPEDKSNKIQIDLSSQEKLEEPKESPSKNKEPHFDILLKENEIKILHEKTAIFSESIDFINLLGNDAYIYLESSGSSKEKAIKDFSICYSKESPRPQRKLEESESTLENIEVDDYCIQSSPNILREGNVHIVPSVILHPKDKNGNFPSAIFNYTLNDLDNLFTVSHSKN